MTYTLTLSAFLLIMFLFAVVLVLDMLDSYKEDKRNDEYRKDIAFSASLESFDEQSWEARQRRFQEMGI